MNNNILLCNFIVHFKRDWNKKRKFEKQFTYIVSLITFRFCHMFQYCCPAFSGIDHWIRLTFGHRNNSSTKNHQDNPKASFLFMTNRAYQNQNNLRFEKKKQKFQVKSYNVIESVNFNFKLRIVICSLFIEWLEIFFLLFWPFLVSYGISAKNVWA